MPKKNSRKFQSKIYPNLSNLIYRAYDTLGDATKKQSYDNFGMTGDQQDQYNQYYNQSGMGGGTGGGFSKLYTKYTLNTYNIINNHF